ncbi:hypothetical protein [Nocardia abscessus]|uniref:hypothetical protein n=1 Tax=Nocardia abscessus TaxID=120957 RepID=UPI0012F72EE4|nr:hypothetical protein [Nocardia abscessus]MCC3328329.1 hypothetical protein [Nocardia abscessus]
MESETAIDREDLYVPDRFEALEESDRSTLRSIIVPVEDSLTAIDNRFLEMRAARRGGLMILKGISGAGKSTFVKTVDLFREDVSAHSLAGDVDLGIELNTFPATDTPRIVVIEGREALGEVSKPAIEASLHAINRFVRSPNGRHTLLIWPVNTDELTTILTASAANLGAEALLGVNEPVHFFYGPNKNDFISIAERTVSALNEGASLSTLGISYDRAVHLVTTSPTIGSFLARVSNELYTNFDHVKKLLPKEQLRMWTVVIAGNDPSSTVGALTRGPFAYADIDRMMTATDANIVAELKKYPAQIGILGTVLDARVLHLDVLSALAVAREYGDDELKSLMKDAGMAVNRDAQAKSRIMESVLGTLLKGGKLGTGRRGTRGGGSTQTAFENLAKIARTSDGAINRAIGNALVDCGIIIGFETEKSLGTELSYKSDIACIRPNGPVRLEMMWRTKTNMAEVSNYTLKKLEQYGKAIKLLT